MGTEDELLLLADGGSGLLDQDDVPNANQSLTCFSCDEPMVGLYCHECGNKNDNYRRSVFSLIGELIQNLTAVDGRMWRSLISLVVKPGRMSREFADGARTRWTSPVRLYIASSLLLFGYIALSQTQIMAVGNVVKNDPQSIANISSETAKYGLRPQFFIRKADLAIPDSEEAEANAREMFEEIRAATAQANDPENLDQAIEELDARIANPTSQAERIALRTTREQLIKARDAAASDVPGSTNGSGDDEVVFNISRADGRKITLDDAGWRQLQQLIIRRPERVNTALNNGLKLALFFMMPLAMFLGAIFIRGRDKAMLYDHLVHAAYIHAFSFLLLLIFILLGQFTPATGLIGVYTIILLIYLPISAKRMFGRGWFKSILTAYGVGAGYSFVMMVVFIIIAAFAFQNIATEISEQQALFNAAEPADAPATTDASEPAR